MEQLTPLQQYLVQIGQRNKSMAGQDNISLPYQPFYVPPVHQPQYTGQPFSIPPIPSTSSPDETTNSSGLAGLTPYINAFKSLGSSNSIQGKSVGDSKSNAPAPQNLPNQNNSQPMGEFRSDLQGTFPGAIMNMFNGQAPAMSGNSNLATGLNALGKLFL